MVFIPAKSWNLQKASKASRHCCGERRSVALVCASNGELAKERRMAPMKLRGIVGIVLFGFLVPGVAAQMSRQSRPSPERGAEQYSGSSPAQTPVELKRFSLLSGNSIDVSPDWIQRGQMALPPSTRLAQCGPQMTFFGFIALGY